MISEHCDQSAYYEQIRSPAQGKEARTLWTREQEVFRHRWESRPAPPPFDVFPTHLAAELLNHWTEPCEAMFEHLATHHSASMIALLQHGKLDPADLTFAAEIAGRLINNGDAVRAVLLPLLRHPDAAVREGTIYGLTRHMSGSVRDTLLRMTKMDPSEAVKTAASDALNEM